MQPSQRDVLLEGREPLYYWVLHFKVELKHWDIRCQKNNGWAEKDE